MGQKQPVSDDPVATELNKLYVEGFTNARVTSSPEPSPDVLREQLRVARLCKQRDPLRRSLQYDLVSLYHDGNSYSMLDAPVYLDDPLGHIAWLEHTLCVARKERDQRQRDKHSRQVHLDMAKKLVDQGFLPAIDLCLSYYGYETIADLEQVVQERMKLRERYLQRMAAQFPGPLDSVVEEGRSEH